MPTTRETILQALHAAPTCGEVLPEYVPAWRSARMV